MLVKKHEKHEIFLARDKYSEWLKQFIWKMSIKLRFSVTVADHCLSFYFAFYIEEGERGGSVVECRTPEREVRGSRPTSAVLCPWARHFTPRKYWLITQEAMAPSRHDWKIVDWDVKPQHNQPTISKKTAWYNSGTKCICITYQIPSKCTISAKIAPLKFRS